MFITLKHAVYLPLRQTINIHSITSHKHFQNMSKKLFILPLFLIGAFLSVTTTSCGDKCKDVECNTGTCLDGTCECGDGFEGTNCEIEWSAKFVGEYLGFDKCGPDTYNLTKPAKVTRVSETSVKIENFGGFDSFINATVSSSDGLTINTTDPAGRVFVGTASVSSTKITGSYKVTYSDGTSDDCTFEYTK